MKRPSAGLIVLVAMVLAGAFLNLKFIFAILALIVVFVGIVEFRQSGARMAVVGLAVVWVLAVAYFDTNPMKAAGAAVFGIKSFDITISVLTTMLMIFLKDDEGAAGSLSRVGFGSFATSLGVVTPALFLRSKTTSICSQTWAWSMRLADPQVASLSTSRTSGTHRGGCNTEPGVNTNSLNRRELFVLRVREIIV